jgi:hypothetical protein
MPGLSLEGPDYLPNIVAVAGNLGHRAAAEPSKQCRDMV